jgi:hypothetical protein
MANKIYLKDGGLNSSTIPEGYIALGSDNGELKLKTGDQISSVGGFTSQIESGLDTYIYSGLSKTTGNKYISGGETFSEWQVIAGVPLIQNDVYFSGSQYVYVKYIGKVVTPIESVISISGQKNTFTSVDTIFDTITTPFGPNGLVTNSATEVEPIAFAGLLIDNSTLSNEYEFWVVAVHSSEFESVVTINTTFIAPEGVEITLDRGPVPVP